VTFGTYPLCSGDRRYIIHHRFGGCSPTQGGREQDAGPELESRGIIVSDGTGLGCVCITLPARGQDYDEPVSVLAAVVRELGGEVFVVRDGDHSVPAADVVILFGKCTTFDGSVRRLRDQATRRPATVLWHIEPLPPDAIPAKAEKAARRLAHCEVNQLPGFLPILARSVPGHSYLLNLVRRACCARLVERCGWNGRTDGRCVHPREWYHAVQNAVWLHERYTHDWCDLVAASTPPRCEVLTRMGIPCEYAPLGYHPLWGTNQGRDRDVDVLFLGRVKRTGREPLLCRLDRQLAGAGVKLLVIERDCYGAQRTELLNRTRICLDLTKNTWETPVLRLLTSMACGALVVSNGPADPYPFRDEHLVRADAEALGAAILEHLRDEPKRRRIAEAACRYVTMELAWGPVVARVLQRACTLRNTCKGVTV
jgi:hypothetical protein